jgi:hypothetical protein
MLGDMVTAMAQEDSAARRLAATQHWVISAAQAHGCGMTVAEINGLCRSGAWRSVYHGIYLLDSDLYHGDELPRLTRISAGLLAAGPDAVAVRQTAAELHGMPTFGDVSTVHAAVPGVASRHRHDGLVIHQTPVPASQQVRAHGLPVSSAVRTVADSVCSLSRFDAVALVDASLNRGLLVDEDLAVVVTMIAGRPGCVAGRRYLAEADGRAQSPAESRVRLTCSDSRLAPDALQHPVYDRHGALLGYADLAWVGAMVAAEVDGAGPHSTPYALFRDRHRQNDFTTVRWRVIRFTWADTYRPGYITATVRAALAASATPG